MATKDSVGNDRIVPSPVLSERLRAALKPADSSLHPLPLYHPSATESPEPQWIFDAARDTAYAHPAHPAFENVLSVFTQEWVGIRAAAGSFPGSKLAVSKSAAWNAAELQRVIRIIDVAGIRVVVAQGASPATLDLLEALRIALPELTIVGVWHGTLAAWAFDEERAIATRFLHLADKGVFDRICLMRRGTHLLHPRAVKYLTPNLVPNVSFKRIAPAMKRRPVTAIFAGWNNQWKNMYANLLAAATSDKVRKVLTYAPASLPGPAGDKLSTLPFQSRRQHFTSLAGCDLVLNVTTVDCHPMVEMEALAVGAPVLRGQLDLDFGEDHPFTRSFTEESVHDAAAIRDRLERVVDIPADEIASMVADYRRLVIDTSFARYGEFLKG